nr:MAG TPA: hypothetical protein [Caudoviricetes sp.]
MTSLGLGMNYLIPFEMMRFGNKQRKLLTL